MDAPSTNRVLPTLMLLALAAWLGLDLVSVAPNRIVAGVGFSVFDIFGWSGTLVGCMALLSATGLRFGRGGLRVALFVVVLLLMALPALLAVAADLLIDPDAFGARLGIGPGFWLLLFLLLLALVELRARLALSRKQVWMLMVPVVGSWWLALTLRLEPLALLQEFQGRREQFASALVQHLELVTAAVVTSLVIGMAAALAMRHYPRFQRIGFAVLNFLQTIPSLALFGLLLTPLAWLSAQLPWLGEWGIRGIGWAPAFLALVLYSLLPMVRNSFVALEGVATAVIESARAMGMSPSQVFIQVRLPLALPVILEGVRITTVQAIGLTAVAALIGAGGLGSFIFQGLGQAAMDLVLLGTLPILIMALLADSLLGALGQRLRPGQIR